MDKLIIGSHVSFKKDDQIVGSIKQALSYGANTFMFYTGAPQNTKREKINLELVEEGKKLMEENGIDYNNVVIHAPYIINFANANNMDFNIHFLKEEIKHENLLYHSYVRKLKDVTKLVLQDLFFIQVLMLKQGTKQE